MSRKSKTFLSLLAFGSCLALVGLCLPSFASEADRSRDDGRKPAEVVAFYGIKSGQTVVDVGAGGGYFTEVFSKAVGKNGTVIAEQDPRMYEKAKAEFADKLTLPNVQLLLEPRDEMSILDNS